MAWSHRAKIAFIGSHGIRKTSAVAGFAATVSRAGQSWDLVREVVRDNPLGLNESATPEAQLWVLTTQISRELELAPKVDILISDRSVVDNYAYFLRTAGRRDPYDLSSFIAAWARSYTLVVRLRPDVELVADGVRSTSDAFRDEIEGILDEILPVYFTPAQMVELEASQITRTFDWWPVAEQLAARVGERLTNPTSSSLERS